GNGDRIPSPPAGGPNADLDQRQRSRLRPIGALQWPRPFESARSAGTPQRPMRDRLLARSRDDRFTSAPFTRAQRTLTITVAIVEDNAVMRKSFRQWIDGAAGFRCVFSCATAEEAVAQIPRLEPDVVLMDIHLPGASGIACTARLKELLPQIQVIMLTV